MKAQNLVLGGFLLGAAACDQGGPGPPPDAPETEDPAGAPTAGAPPGTLAPEQPGAAAPREERLTAYARLEPTEGNSANGLVQFSAGEEMVSIAGTIGGLPPGEHGFHIHERGDCSAPDASSAGDHFNPDDNPHGSPRDPADQRHVGDLGNVTADADGDADIAMEHAEMQLEGADSIIGKAVVVHADPDDFESQPSGNAGDRLGCGVIEPGS